jgi:hypothetical protein
MSKEIKLGLKENIYQFTLLVIVNAFVGAMIGLERTLLPEIAEKDFNMVAKTAILPSNKRIVLVNCDNSPEMRKETVWDALLNLSEDRLYGERGNGLFTQGAEPDLCRHRQ